MIALHVTIPVACWRRGWACEFLETELLPPPSTCYGALLSLVGEEDRERHRGCRVTAGLLNTPGRSTILRTLWRIKTRDKPQGTGENARPDLQELLTQSDLLIFCESAEECGGRPHLEERVVAALTEPSKHERYGGWSLGESSHLIDQAHFLWGGEPLPGPCRTFLEREEGELTLPVWVDHVGSEGTRYACGTLELLTSWPDARRIPKIIERQ